MKRILLMVILVPLLMLRAHADGLIEGSTGITFVPFYQQIDNLVPDQFDLRAAALLTAVDGGPNVSIGFDAGFFGFGPIFFLCGGVGKDIPLGSALAVRLDSTVGIGTTFGIGYVLPFAQLDCGAYLQDLRYTGLYLGLKPRVRVELAPNLTSFVDVSLVAGIRLGRHRGGNK